MSITAVTTNTVIRPSPKTELANLIMRAIPAIPMSVYPHEITELAFSFCPQISVQNTPIERVTNENIIKIQSIVIDCEKCRVEKNDIVIELTKLEYDLLIFLAKNPDKIFPRE